MHAEKLHAVSQADMDFLSTTANNKARLTDKPFKFLPPVRIFSHADSKLRWWGAENGGSVASGRPGGIAINSTTLVAEQLMALPHTNPANWQQAANFRVWRDPSGRPPGLAGAFGAEINDITGRFLRRWSTVTNRWESYGGWRSELVRLRGQLFQTLFGGGLDALHVVQRDGLWYEEPKFQSYRGVWSDEVLPFNTTNSWATFGFRPDWFKDIRYVYPVTPGVVTRIEMTANIGFSVRNPDTNASTQVIATVRGGRVTGGSWDIPNGETAKLSFTSSFDIGGDTNRNLDGSTVPYEVIDTMGIGHTTEVRPSGGSATGFVRIIRITAVDVPWGGEEFSVGVRITPTPGIVARGGNYFGTVRFTLGGETGSEPANGIHHTLPLRQIRIFNTDENEPPPWAWGRDIPSGLQIQPAGPVPPGTTEIWQGCLDFWRAVPFGDTTGMWLARPMPLSNVEFEQFQETRTDTTSYPRSVLQRYARAPSVHLATQTPLEDDTDGLVRVNGASQRTPRDYEVTRNCIYNPPQVYVRELKLGTTEAELAYQRQLYMYGSKQQGNWRYDRVHGPGMIYSVTARRNGEDRGDVRQVDFGGDSERSVVVGYLFNGTTPAAFKVLGTITIGQGQESATIYPQWPIFDGTSLCFKSSTMPCTVFATIVPKSPGASRAYDPLISDVFDSSSTTTPIMAAHFNDTEKMLTALDALP